MEEKERKDESQEHNGVPAQTQQSGLRGERRDSGMSDFSPQAEMSDMQPAPTKAARCEQGRRDNSATNPFRIRIYKAPLPRGAFLALICIDRTAFGII